MRSLDELTFQIELPVKPADAIDRIDAACDESALGLEGVREGEPDPMPPWRVGAAVPEARIHESGRDSRLPAECGHIT